MRRELRVAAVALTGVALALSAAGCGGKKATTGGGGGGSSAAAKTVKVGLAYDIGGRGDKSFNDAAYAGLQRVEKELKLDVKDVEAKEGESDNDKIQRLTLLAQSGYNPVIGVGFVYAPAVKAVAAKFPAVKFAIIDDSSITAPNVTSLIFAEQEGSYLVGAAAAAKSKTGTIGFIGGVNTDLIKKFEAGYTAGAKKINPKIKVLVKYITNPPNFDGFKDPASAKTIATSQYDQGADVVYHAAGLSGNGLFQAAAAKKKLAIGVDSDQYVSADPSQQPYILTSMLKRVDTAVYDFVKSVSDGTVKPGPVEFNLKNDGIGYSTANTAALTSDITAKLDGLKQQIVSGAIIVPTK